MLWDGGKVWVIMLSFDRRVLKGCLVLNVNGGRNRKKVGRCWRGVKGS